MPNLCHSQLAKLFSNVLEIWLSASLYIHLFLPQIYEQSDLIILMVALDIFMQVKIHIPFYLLSVFYLMCAQAHAHTWSQTSNLTDCCNLVFVVIAVQ